MPGIVRFTLVMGPLSSLFDIATFALLLLLFRVDVQGALVLVPRPK